jgi:hypothetical protein
MNIGKTEPEIDMKCITIRPRDGHSEFTAGLRQESAKPEGPRALTAARTGEQRAGTL